MPASDKEVVDWLARTMALSGKPLSAAFVDHLERRIKKSRRQSKTVNTVEIVSVKRRAAVGRDQYDFHLTPSEATTIMHAKRTSPQEPLFRASYARIVMLNRGSEASLGFFCSGIPATGSSDKLNVQWQTVSDFRHVVHFKYAPSWVHSFIHEHTSFGPLLTKAMALG